MIPEAWLLQRRYTAGTNDISDSSVACTRFLSVAACIKVASGKDVNQLGA